MKSKHSIYRLLAAALALIMVIAMVPSIVVSGTGTVKGDSVTVTVGQDETSARENNFNKGWKFNLGDISSAYGKDFNDSGWTDVDLPHDFSIIQNFSVSGEAESGFLPGGTGWYRKSFTIPEEQAGKTFLLNFDGVYMHAYVYVNGTAVGEHHYGYTNFAFDITDYLLCDGTENVIAVKAVNNIPSSRWYSGSGIYRDVTLLALDPVHVDLNGTKVTTPNISTNNGTVNVEVDVVNDGTASASVTVKNTVYAKGSTTALASAESTITVAAGATVPATNAPVVSGPKLWSIESPNLYTVKTEVLVGGQVVDTYETEFGFRWFTFSSTGFALNGKNVKLDGVCLHHDQGAAGSAAYYDAMYRQLSIMKDMGCNAIRTSHNPADRDFIAICNELGLLVIEEAFDGLVDPKNTNYNDFSGYFEAAANSGLYGVTSGMTNAEYAARSIVQRDRNAPSVFAWSFGNEIQEGTYWNNVSRYDDICANFITWVNAEDGSRIVTSGDNNRGGDADLVNVINTITNAGGVAGFNYANDISTLSSLASSYGGKHGCIIASETASHTNSRGVYTTQASNSTSIYHQTSYDTSAVSWGITAHDSIYNTYNLDNVAGEFVWTGFDYIGEPTPFNGTSSGAVQYGSGATPNSAYFGIVETTGFPKDSYYLYRAQWHDSATTLHLVTAWDSGNMMTSSGKTPVWVYSNAPIVKLYREVNGTAVLVGTATRVDHTSAAGHTYYTYNTTANDTSLCTTSSGSGADGLYAVFNVTYADGTLYAKAYQADGTTEIPLDDTCGQHTVTTPGTVTQLIATPNKTTVEADGSSLVYIEVDVTDANGNLDTTASNNITFTLSGPGKIVGVDNGDQATTAKYQNSSVKTNDTSALINAYAGKALVIVRTTEDAGEITVNIASSGLTGDTVVINAAASGSESGSAGSSLASYDMVKDYSIKVGNTPELDTTVEGTLSDGSTVSGSIVWDALPAASATTAGDYVVNGTLTFSGHEPLQVSARLHVIPEVIAMRNIATATTSSVVPTLPNVVNGVLADGTVTGEFSVEWDTVSADSLATVGDIVTVNGTATVLGSETLPVTCTIRVAQEVQTESENIGQQADSLTQNINGSDELTSVINGTTKPGDNTSERWSNWGNRTTSAEATLTLTWATAHLINRVNIFYYYDNCSAKPESVEFSYSLGGQEYTVIGHTEAQEETYDTGAQFSYTFDNPVDPVGLKIKFTQQSGTSGDHCVAVTEIQVMTYVAALEYKTSADLSGITVDGTAVENFAADTLAYTADGSTVAATTAENAGITVLPVYNGVVRVLTIAEDGSETKTYEVTVGNVCAHTNTEIRDESDATCTAQGYTGDTYCSDCGIRISTGSSIAATGHSWDTGVVTQEPTASAPGIKTYTCGTCNATRTEDIPYDGAVDISVSLALNTDGSVLVFRGSVDNYVSVSANYTLVKHGILYIASSGMGSGELTNDTTGRTRATFSAYTADGAFTYYLTPDSEATDYTVRAFLVYVDPATNDTVTVYSEALTGSLNSLN